MSQQMQDIAASVDRQRVPAAIVQLARGASIEINVQDTPHLDASRKFLAAGTRVYVSHLPKQAWQATADACSAARAAGFEPVPHIPARLIPDADTFDRVLADLVARAQVQNVLLISGDYPQAEGPFSSVSELLRTGLLGKHGIKSVCVAGHPEGHPKVALEEIRRAELEKAELAQQLGLQMSFVTQFFFEHEPFVQWVQEMRHQGVTARLVGGLAGPAGLTTLFKFAMRCGAGPSIRALGARPTSLMKLVGERGPENVVRGLAEAQVAGAADLNGIHMFCFGGFLRTCEWLHAVAQERFTLDERGSFEVKR